MKNCIKPFLTAAMLSVSTPVLADSMTVEVEKLADINEIFRDVRGNYDRQDGLYSLKVSDYGPEGETLACTVMKDTTVVYNLQGTPQALAEGISHHCFLLPRSPQ